MELQQFIDGHPDYLERFRENGVKLRNKQHLVLLTFPYGKPVPTDDDDMRWLRYCRGAVIDKISHKVICCPPLKAHELSYNEDIPEGDYEYEPLLDGTMINLFYDARSELWRLSTRGEIGGYNKWDAKGSFKQMFEECQTSVDYDSLDRTCSYSFVMRHVDNRIVSPVNYNELYLVEMYSYENGVRRLQQKEYPPSSFQLPESVSDVNEFMKIYDRDLPYYLKGFTIKAGTQRYKYLNPHYLYVRNLKPNTNNPYLNYLTLRGNGILREYLSYFPEEVELYNEYRDKVHKFSNDLYSAYKNVHVYKTMEKKEIPYHMKPLLYEIHGQYLETKEPTSWSHIKNYIHDLPPKKLIFALNYC